MGVIARAVYDFDGDSSQGELVFTAGDVIDIINQVGECTLIRTLRAT